jgi:hypothetical protein
MNSERTVFFRLDSLALLRESQANIIFDAMQQKVHFSCRKGADHCARATRVPMLRREEIAGGTLDRAARFP